MEYQTLRTTPLEELPLGSIEPQGWLRDQLQIQMEGFTGKLPDYWYDLGPDSGWLGGSGESWERGPYYLDGLLPIAYLLKDESIIAKTTPWIEWTLASQQANGQFGPSSNNDYWSRMVMLKVLMQYEEATGDERVVPFMTRYFKYQLEEMKKRPLVDWAQARGGDNLLSVFWLYRRTGDDFLLQLAKEIHRQTLDWTHIFTNFPYWRYQERFDHRIHVVNVAMGLKEPALYYLLSGEDIHRDAAIKGIDSLMTYHGQLHGMFSGDEWLAGTHPSQGVELCAVVEYMFTLTQLIRIYGDARFGDILEKVAFNALPATISADWSSRQYVQQVNQIRCTASHRNWTENRDDANMFGFEPNFGCCTANMHQGWPKLAARLWMASGNNGLAAISYAPCRIKAVCGNGAQAEITVDSQYPFRDRIDISIALNRSEPFPIHLRIPEWCSSPEIAINGNVQSFAIENGFAVIARTWSDGDCIRLTLPMSIQVERRADDAVGIVRGPLLYAMPLPEVWQRRTGNPPFFDYEVFEKPGTIWNYGLLIGDDPNASVHVEWGDIERQPFVSDTPPIKLIVQGRQVPEWKEEKNSAGTPPISPVESDRPLEEITLVPYGGARLRIAEFPKLLK